MSDRCILVFLGIGCSAHSALTSMGEPANWGIVAEPIFRGYASAHGTSAVCECQCVIGCAASVDKR